MKNVLYIGNKLNNSKSNLSSIDTLGLLLEREGFNMYYASSKVNKIARLLDMLKSCIIHRKIVDFVIIDTYSTQNFYYALLVTQLCRVFKLKYIPSLNGGNLPMRLKRNPKMCRVVFEPAYKIVSPSLYLKEAFESFGYNSIYYIPNSLELNLYDFKSKDFKEVKLLWVRSFSKIYNPILAIKVLKSLKDDGVNASLCMVGPDSDGSLGKVKKLEKSLKLSVKFTGKLSKKKWIFLAKDYNIFINTTNFDNMPVSVLEAMALGLTVVSTNVGGLSYLITHQKDGLLVPPNNVKLFVRAIKRLIENPDSSRVLAINARRKVELFDWDVIKHQWINLLQ